MKTVITGGAGFIGSHLTDHLLGTGNSVTVLDDFSTGSRANLTEAAENPRFHLVEGSVLDRRLVNGIVADAISLLRRPGRDSRVKLCVGSDSLC